MVSNPLSNQFLSVCLFYVKSKELKIVLNYCLIKRPLFSKNWTTDLHPLYLKCWIQKPKLNNLFSNVFTYCLHPLLNNNYASLLVILIWILDSVENKSKKIKGWEGIPERSDGIILEQQIPDIYIIYYFMRNYYSALLWWLVTKSLVY